MGDPSSLTDAIRTYEARREELLAAGKKGQFALVYEGDVSIFPAEDDALREGYRRHRNVPFLVREISEQDPQMVVRSVNIGHDVTPPADHSPTSS